ncbi:hypothetical protein Pelo_3080 [Pelomyxa schiedti]|nr:hypothetical protein Pelo_3080 [Pelomyxa schiedti]
MPLRFSASEVVAACSRVGLRVFATEPQRCPGVAAYYITIVFGTAEDALHALNQVCWLSFGDGVAVRLRPTPAACARGLSLQQQQLNSQRPPLSALAPSSPSSSPRPGPRSHWHPRGAPPRQAPQHKHSQPPPPQREGVPGARHDSPPPMPRPRHTPQQQPRPPHIPQPGGHHHRRPLAPLSPRNTAERPIGPVNGDADPDAATGSAAAPSAPTDNNTADSNGAAIQTADVDMPGVPPSPPRQHDQQQEQVQPYPHPQPQQQQQHQLPPDTAKTEAEIAQRLAPWLAPHIPWFIRRLHEHLVTTQLLVKIMLRPENSALTTNPEDCNWISFLVSPQTLGVMGTPTLQVQHHDGAGSVATMGKSCLCLREADMANRSPF